MVRSHRFRICRGSYDAFVHPRNRRAIIFVHGLGGDNTDSYWGRLIELLCYDRSLVACDFYFWRYKSSHWLTLRAFSPSSETEKLSSLPEISASLADDVREIQLSNHYQSISLLGHCLGGLVCLGALSRIASVQPAIPIKSICLFETPLVALWVAKGGYFLSLWTNPHLQFLSKRALISNVISAGMAAAKSLEAPVIYMYCIGDTLFRLHSVYRQRGISETIVMQGPHWAMARIKNRSSENYRRLVDYIIQKC